MIEILRGVVGSHAYGMAHKGSDIDTAAIHVQPTLALVGLDMGERPDETFTTKSPDTLSRELRSYLFLALKNNPAAMDLVWLTDYVTLTDWGAELVGLRETFLSQRIRDSYLKYAHSQFEKLQKSGRFTNVPVNRMEKNARHMLRLVQQATGIWVTGKLHVEVDNPAGIRERAHHIVTDPKGPDYALRHLAAVESYFDDTPTALPEHPDPAPAADFLRRVRSAYMKEGQWDHSLTPAR
ncbi:nucleotidyltransferase [Gordonia phage VanLee]|uniref:Nucleotidyltransferase n=1 Tax=Gordonia phage VanLee TaxID=2845816 RepID=A0A8F2D9J2_9CAUD|nr:nucleotidyltransferase [Gordonia phage VanLee]QWS68227.1 nucleotidyltransferase [Gordonia phage VanLee]